MPPESTYQIPENSDAQASARLYAQYRVRLDTETRRREAARIIDVAAKRVEVERSAPAPTETGANAAPPAPEANAAAPPPSGGAEANAAPPPPRAEAGSARRPESAREEPPAPPEETEEAAEGESANNGGSRSVRRPVENSAPPPPNEPLRYERPRRSGEVPVTMAPARRGLFVDVVV